MMLSCTTCLPAIDFSSRIKSLLRILKLMIFSLKCTPLIRFILWINYSNAKFPFRMLFVLNRNLFIDIKDYSRRSYRKALEAILKAIVFYITWRKYAGKTSQSRHNMYSRLPNFSSYPLKCFTFLRSFLFFRKNDLVG